LLSNPLALRNPRRINNRPAQEGGGGRGSHPPAAWRFILAPFFLSVPILALARLLFYEWRKPVPALVTEDLALSLETSAELDAVI
jgi:hypothetical protein